ncbi:hypothetical protein QTP70_003128 [Hemibagrus guttatus]|uniref:Protein-tyrosine sulfotransferase n=1 Tax=Hemibagrus guttatus TaxID=175788 RepID=A0AAE0UX52_9TELE|nr:hypothetical protein QTP70_003128 [Hemibagrus guttatus]
MLMCQGGYPHSLGVSVLVKGSNQTLYHYSQNSPMVFVGGVPRSGTTLMRAMLDAHPDIRCGEETRVIPRLLAMRHGWRRSAEDRWALDEEAITQEMLDSATAAFLLEVIARHGSTRCMSIRYENLVLRPRTTMERVLEFLNVPWHEGVLHHEEAIGQPGGVSLSRIERSTDQVIKPVNLEALTRWVGHIPVGVLKDMDNIAPMLNKLGYDPTANPPDYGQPDPEVIHNTERVLKGDFKPPANLKRPSQESIT